MITEDVIKEFIRSSDVRDCIGMLKEAGLLGKANRTKIKKEIRKVLIILSANYWHSSESDDNIYHTSYNCNHAKYINADNIMSGKGGRNHCPHCKGFEKK